jgi:hypothetical protein
MTRLITQRRTSWRDRVLREGHYWCAAGLLWYSRSRKGVRRIRRRARELYDVRSHPNQMTNMAETLFMQETARATIAEIDEVAVRGLLLTEAKRLRWADGYLQRRGGNDQ